MAYAGKAGQTRTRSEVASRSGRSGTLAAGVAIGVLVGVGLALLIAPRSGRDMRRMIGRGIRRVGGRGRDAWEDLSDELRRARRQLRRARRLKRELASQAADAVDAIPGA